MFPALVGAGLSVAGNVANAYGQAQGLRAMRDVWDNQQRIQAEQDARLQARTDSMLNGISPQGVMGSDVAEATTNQLGSQARMTANAVTKAGRRKTGGASAGSEVQARMAQGNQGTLAQAIQDAHMAGILRGLQVGQNNQSNALRSYGQDAGLIRDDARGWASLVPMQERAAGMAGGAMRGVGNAANMVGQGLMSYGMSRPGQVEQVNRYNPSDAAYGDPTAANWMYQSNPMQPTFMTGGR